MPQVIKLSKAYYGSSYLFTISKPVGWGWAPTSVATNDPLDVKLVQFLLKPFPRGPAVDGRYGPVTDSAMLRYLATNSSLVEALREAYDPDALKLAPFKIIGGVPQAGTLGERVMLHLAGGRSGSELSFDFAQMPGDLRLALEKNTKTI